MPRDTTAGPRVAPAPAPRPHGGRAGPRRDLPDRPDRLAGYRALAASFRRHLLAENKSPRTVETYGDGIRLFGEFLAEQGMPADVAHVRREHVEAFIAALLARWKPATASNRYRALQVFFRWLGGRGRDQGVAYGEHAPAGRPRGPACGC